MAAASGAVGTTTGRRPPTSGSITLLAGRGLFHAGRPERRTRLFEQAMAIAGKPPSGGPLPVLTGPVLRYGLHLFATGSRDEPHWRSQDPSGGKRKNGERTHRYFPSDQPLIMGAAHSALVEAAAAGILSPEEGGGGFWTMR